MLVSHSHQNEVELVLHKPTSSCYMDAELAAIILIYLLSELTLLTGNELTDGEPCRMHFMLQWHEQTIQQVSV
ncbi:hypothetical protein NG99_02550 [Erwinia typographi]|uniref:Uncharacterized protein n=1 Tax=Erwinia typographi TaxID=371042 RepID=A0A0A4ACQ0_9GAMM|nr:hypothetical protein NG99_02550 [Erwinia typographi]